MLHLPFRQNQNHGDLVLGRLGKYRFSPLYRIPSSARTAHLYVIGLSGSCDAVVGRSAIAGNLASLLDRYAWKPDLSACDAPLPAGIRKGIDQFNNRAFYRCHDSIELVWVDEPGDVRLMYQGLLQIAVAFYHVQKGNWRGMVKMMVRGKGKLLPFLPACQGIDLEGLLADVERCEVDLRELGADRMADFDPALLPVIPVTG